MNFFDFFSYDFLGDFMDKELAYILTHIYSSNESVLTNILQYQYQLLFMDQEWIHDKMKKILKKEVTHLETLGRLIKNLGCDPIYADINFGIVEFWNSNHVYYDIDLVTMLDVDIEMKKKNIGNCQMIIHLINNEDVKDCLKKIMEDDYKTLETFMKIRTQIV